jgi:hypothetical protein
MLPLESPLSTQSRRSLPLDSNAVPHSRPSLSGGNESRYFKPPLDAIIPECRLTLKQLLTPIRRVPRKDTARDTIIAKALAAWPRRR